MNDLNHIEQANEFPFPVIFEHSPDFNLRSVTSYTYADYIKFRLLVSNDVETNPGPTEYEQILKAIKESETNLISKMTSLQDEIQEIRQDILTVKSEFGSLKSDLKCVQNKQEALEGYLILTDKTIGKCQDTIENVQLDVEAVANKIDQQAESIKFLQNDMVQLQQKNLANNMRIFGLEVDSNASYKQLVKLIIDKVLKVAAPDIDWVPDDIKTAKVLGNGRQGLPPIILLIFRHDDDKFRIYNGRVELRSYAIRVGDDLTYYQRQQLKTLKTQNGKTGYFYRGKLYVRGDVQADSSNNRVFRKATRKVQQDTTTVEQTIDLTENAMEDQ